MDDRTREAGLTRALVLGSGGLTGIAWEVGVLNGLREVGIDPAGADHIVGTSAGAIVGAHLALSTDPSALFEHGPPPGRLDLGVL